MDKNLKEEYEDVSANVRHYGNHQFAQFTVFVALISGLIFLVFGSNDPFSPITANLFKVAGLVISLLFWLMAESAMFMWARLSERAAVLERTLGYQQYSSLPGAPKFQSIRPARWAISIFYLLIFSFWLLCLSFENILLIIIVVSGAIICAISITIEPILPVIGKITNHQSKKELKKTIKTEIGYEQVAKVAKEVIKLLPNILKPKILGMKFFHFYAGLAIRMDSPEIEDTPFLESIFKSKDESLIYFFCKFKGDISSNEITIVGSDQVKETINKSPWRSYEAFHLQYILNQIIAAGWNPVVLQSPSEDLGYLLLKYCLYKDDSLLIYSIKKVPRKE